MTTALRSTSAANTPATAANGVGSSCGAGGLVPVPSMDGAPAAARLAMAVGSDAALGAAVLEHLAMFPPHGPYALWSAAVLSRRLRDGLTLDDPRLYPPLSGVVHGPGMAAAHQSPSAALHRTVALLANEDHPTMSRAPQGPATSRGRRVEGKDEGAATGTCDLASSGPPPPSALSPQDLNVFCSSSAGLDVFAAVEGPMTAAARAVAPAAVLTGVVGRLLRADHLREWPALYAAAAVTPEQVRQL